jgi:hypothetical protein
MVSDDDEGKNLFQIQLLAPLPFQTHPPEMELLNTNFNIILFYKFSFFLILSILFLIKS